MGVRIGEATMLISSFFLFQIKKIPLQMEFKFITLPSATTFRSSEPVELPLSRPWIEDDTFLINFRFVLQKRSAASRKIE